MDEDIIDELDDHYVDISIDEDILNDDVDDYFIIDDGIDIDINYDVIDDYHQSMMTSMTMLRVSSDNMVGDQNSGVNTLSTEFILAMVSTQTCLRGF